MNIHIQADIYFFLSSVLYSSSISYDQEKRPMDKLSQGLKKNFLLLLK